MKFSEWEQNLQIRMELIKSEIIDSDILGIEEYNLIHNCFLYSRLTKRQIKLLTLRIDGMKTLEECGLEFGVDRDRIRQIEATARRKMEVLGYEEKTVIEII